MKYLKLVFLFAFACSNILKAQSDSIKEIKVITITYQAYKRMPVTFQNINFEEIKLKSVGQEPSFLLSETPSVTAYSDAGNTQGYSYLRLRGIDQTRINMTLNGVPLNEPEDQGAYFSNFPDVLNSVSKIQIQRGVGTSKNGVASYGGSVQLFSVSPFDSAKLTVGSGYGSFNTTRAFVEYNSGVKNNKGFYCRASEIYTDGYKHNAFNHSQSIFVSHGWYYKKNTWRLNLLSGHQQNGLAWLGVSDSLIALDRRTNANQNEKDNFTQSMIQLQNNKDLTSTFSLQSSLYYIFLKGNYDFNLNGFLGLPSTDELYNYAFQSNLLGFYSNLAYNKGNFNWVTGVHANAYERRHIGSEKILGRLYMNKGQKKEASIVSKIDYDINNLTLFADVQYRFSTFDYKGDVALNKMQWQFLNPKAGLTYELDEHKTFYYSVGHMAREPTRNDIFGGNDNLLADTLGKSLVFNQQAEFVLDHELGFRFSTKKIHFDMNFYYMNFKNEIVLNGKFGPNGLLLTNNVAKSFRSGVEFSCTYQLNKNISFINNSSWNRSKIREQNEVFSPILTPRWIINQELNYTKKNLTFGISGRFQEQSYIDFANSSNIDSYFLLNARLQYIYKKIQIGFFLNNLTNAKYYNNGYIDFDLSKKFFVQAPLNFYTSIAYRF